MVYQELRFLQCFRKDGRRKKQRCLRRNKLQNHWGYNNRISAKQPPTGRKLRGLESQTNRGSLQKSSSFYAKGFKSQQGQFKIDPLSFYKQ